MTKDEIVMAVNSKAVPNWIKQTLYYIYIWYGDMRNTIKYGDKYFFRNAAIEISTKCNRQCSYCPNSKFPTDEKFMSTKLFDMAIDRLKEIDFEGSLYFHFYNEPLLDKRIVDFVQKAKIKLPKAMIRIFTNGDFLDEKLLAKLIKSGVMELVITNHLPQSVIWKNKFEKLKKKWNKYLNLQSLFNTPLSNRGGLVEIKNQEVRDNCIEPLRTVQIDYEGNVILCCNDFFRTYKFGNIKKEGLKNIWEKEKFVKLRKDLRQGKVDLPICKKCLNIND